MFLINTEYTRVSVYIYICKFSYILIDKDVGKLSFVLYKLFNKISICFQLPLHLKHYCHFRIQCNNSVCTDSTVL